MRRRDLAEDVVSKEAPHPSVPFGLGERIRVVWVIAAFEPDLVSRQRPQVLYGNVHCTDAPGLPLKFPEIADGAFRVRNLAGLDELAALVVDTLCLEAGPEFRHLRGLIEAAAELVQTPGHLDVVGHVAVCPQALADLAGLFEPQPQSERNIAHVSPWVGLDEIQDAHPQLCGA